MNISLTNSSMIESCLKTVAHHKCTLQCSEIKISSCFSDKDDELLLIDYFTFTNIFQK